jgi:hypothetical protein
MSVDEHEGTAAPESPHPPGASEHVHVVPDLQHVGHVVGSVHEGVVLASLATTPHVQSPNWSNAHPTGTWLHRHELPASGYPKSAQHWRSDCALFEGQSVPLSAFKSARHEHDWSAYVVHVTGFPGPLPVMHATTAPTVLAAASRSATSLPLIRTPTLGVRASRGRHARR